MKFNINEIIKNLLIRYPDFLGIIQNVDFKPYNGLTASTDGYVIYYNESFLASLSMQEQIFVIAHEILHIALNHILRSEGKNIKIWNYATDAVINQLLKRDGLRLCPNVIDVADAINYTAEELYQKKLKEQEEQKSNNSQQENSQSGNSDESQNEQSDSQEQNENSGHDSHDMWEDAIKKHKQKEEQKKNGKETADEQSKKEKSIEEEQKKFEGKTEKEILEKNNESFNKIKEEYAKRAEYKQQEKLHNEKGGTGTSESEREVSDVGTEQLAFKLSKYLRPPKRYYEDYSETFFVIENGIVTPELEEKGISQIEILIDTSGSVDIELLKCFLQQCKAILQTSKRRLIMKIGCFDVSFYGFTQVRTPEDIDKLQIKGGGGTDFEVAVKSFSRRAENRIIFTDGQSILPQTKVKALWIVYGEMNKENQESFKPPGGRVVFITQDLRERRSRH